MKSHNTPVKVIGKIDLDNMTTTDEVTHVGARHTAKDGTVLDSWHRFSVDKGISKLRAQELQAELGYHPLGYGFHNFDATMTKTTWRCFHSCD